MELSPADDAWYFPDNRAMELGALKLRQSGPITKVMGHPSSQSQVVRAIIQEGRALAKVRRPSFVPGHQNVEDAKQTKKLLVSWGRVRRRKNIMLLALS